MFPLFLPRKSTHADRWENAFLPGLCCPCRCFRGVASSLSDQRTPGVGKLVPCSFNIHPPHVLDLTPTPRGDKASQRSEGMPAFGLPVLSSSSSLSRSFSKFIGSNQASLSGSFG